MAITGDENTMNADVILGRLLGRREAFSLVAARCSAAEAQTLREIREKKLYLNLAADWGGFCVKYLHMGKANANRIIRLLDEFGAAYFEVAQLTQISAATYREIAPSIDEQGLNYNGDVIALIPENAAKVAAAVAEIRKTVPIKAEAPEPADPLSLLEDECRALSAKIERAIPLAQDRRWQLKLTVCRLRDRLNLLEVKI